MDFDPDAWLDLAEEAGMEYIVLTTKHHDGFCLWDTKQTDFNVMNSPYGKDIVAMLAEACHRRDFSLGLYYSVADWHHPNYPNQGRSHELDGPEPGDEPDLDKYVAFLKEQIRELMTNYGKIHCLWWDMNQTGREDPSVNALARELQPGILINPRGFGEGDFATPERDFASDKWGAPTHELLAFETPVEACQSVGIESWGYRKDEDYYTDKYLMQSIDRIMAKGGNYLLNVGPTAEGVIPPESTRILKAIGAWYGKVREAVREAAPASHLTDNREVLLTRRGDSLYVHLYTDPKTKRVVLKPMSVKPDKAVLLNTGEELPTRVELVPSEHATGAEYLHVRELPVNDLTGTVPVVRLDFAPGALG